MQLFYASEISGDFITLSKTESNHCINVLRHSVSDTIHMIDGKGGIFVAMIIEATAEVTAAAVDITLKTSLSPTKVD